MVVYRLSSDLMPQTLGQAHSRFTSKRQEERRKMTRDKQFNFNAKCRGLIVFFTLFHWPAYHWSLDIRQHPLQACFSRNRKLWSYKRGPGYIFKIDDRKCSRFVCGLHLGPRSSLERRVTVTSGRSSQISSNCFFRTRSTIKFDWIYFIPTICVLDWLIVLQGAMGAGRVVVGKKVCGTFLISSTCTFTHCIQIKSLLKCHE